MSPDKQTSLEMKILFEKEKIDIDATTFVKINTRVNASKRVDAWCAS